MAFPYSYFSILWGVFIATSLVRILILSDMDYFYTHTHTQLYIHIYKFIYLIYHT